MHVIKTKTNKQILFPGVEAGKTGHFLVNCTRRVSGMLFSSYGFISLSQILLPVSTPFVWQTSIMRHLGVISTGISFTWNFSCLYFLTPQVLIKISITQNWNPRVIPHLCLCFIKKIWKIFYESTLFCTHF